MAATTEGIAERKVHLKVLVDKEKNKVIFAEAARDFVDILFSFLTLPLGTIVRLVNKCSDSSSTKIGSLSTLYEGVANIGTEHFWNDPRKDMLLHPRKSSLAQCKELKINIDDTDPTKYFNCGACWRTFSTYKNTRCTCGNMITSEIINIIYEGFGAGEGKDGAFVPEKASFIITDDLQVIPNVVGKSIALLTNLGISDMNKLNIHPLDLGTNEILLLLKWSVLSKTPLTNLISGKLHLSAAANAGLTTCLTNSNTDQEDESCNKMSIRVMVQKSNQKIVFAQVEEDFVNFLFSFLTIPLGSVVSLLGGKSNLGSIDNLYRSILCLDVDRYIKSQDLKDMLLNPKLGTNSLHKNQILPIIEEVPKLEYAHGYVNGMSVRQTYLTTEHGNTRHKLTRVDPENPNSGCKGLGGFVRAPALFNVTDDLLVTPVSSIYAIYALDKLRIPFTHVEEKVVNIGMKEALGILKCSLTSTSALTDSLNLILKSPKQEP